MTFGDRLRRFLRTIFYETSEEAVPPKQPPDEPPYDGPGNHELSEPSDERMREIWFYITGVPAEWGDYEDYKEIFYDTGVLSVEEDQDEIVQLWDQFLRAFYLTTNESGSVSRSDWYAASGLHRDRIDWAAWREVKRGTP